MDNPPERKKGDLAYAAAKGLIGSIPIAGHGLVAGFEYLVVAPLEKRREAWFKKVAELLTELENRNPRVTINQLQQDEHFISCLVSATQTAFRSHQNEKLEILKLAVQNTVGIVDKEADKQASFLRILDELTPTHIKVLSILRIRTNENQDYVGKAYELIPELRGEEHYMGQRAAKTLIGLIVKDLQARGLLYTEEDLAIKGPNKPSMAGAGATIIAKDFLDFIGIEPHPNAN